MNHQLIFMTLETMQKFLNRKRPRNILFLYKGEIDYIKACKKFLDEKKINTLWDAIAFVTPEDEVFDKVYPVSILHQLDTLSNYDLILMSGAVDDFEKNEIVFWIEALLTHTVKDLCILELNFQDEAPHTRLSPLMFSRFNYKFSTYQNEEGYVNLHLFLPMPKHPELPLDHMIDLGVCEKKLKLAYWLAHIHLTGGTKMLLEQARQMTRRGHKVTIYRRGKAGEQVLPEWCDLDEAVDVSKTVLVTSNQPMEACIASDTDIIMLSSPGQLREMKAFSKPIVLWEQGYEHLFGEVTNEEMQFLLLQHNMRQVYSLPIHIFSVSPTIQEIMAYRYGRKTYVLSNGIDTGFYHPSYIKIRMPQHKLTILLVGNPHLRFKGFDRAFRILDRLYESSVCFKVQWIGQESIASLDKPYEVEFIVKPSQQELAKYYRGADLLLSTSVYEGFAMPPLEAMASGISVVSTNNGGIMSYAKNGENALICEEGDEEALYEALLKVATHRDLRNKLAKKGRETALTLDYTKVMQRLEELLFSVYEYWNKKSIED